MIDKSLFVTETIHEREITLGNGDKHRLHFREIPSATLRSLQTALNARAEDHELAVTKVIVASLCLADGSPAVTLEEAGKLKHGVRLAIAGAIAEVNDLGASVGKVLPPETPTSGSGTSSS